MHPVYILIARPGHITSEETNQLLQVITSSVINRNLSTNCVSAVMQIKVCVFEVSSKDRVRSSVERWAHNGESLGSNPGHGELLDEVCAKKQASLLVEQ